MNTPRFSRNVLFILVLSSLIATTAYANAGTGFFFPGIVHVLIGNVIIGLIEAFFIRKVFKVSAKYGIIILGNYVSSIIGYIVTLIAFSDIDLLSVSVLPKSLTLWFIASVLLEWPFFAWAVKERMFGFSKSSFKYTFYAQCVSYAILVPYHFLTFDQGLLSASMYIEDDLNALAANASMFRARGHVYGGGGGSYGGFAIPETYPTDLGRFTATSSKDSIVFIVMNIESTRTRVSVVLDSSARLHSWKYGIEPGDESYRKNVTYFLNRLAEIAFDYRMRPFLVRGGPEVYTGYSIPGRLSVTERGEYSATIVSRDSIVFVAMDRGRTRTIAGAVLDSAGKLHSWEYRLEPRDIPYSEVETADLNNFAGLAYQYRIRPLSMGGGGGSYDGFSLPEKLSITRNNRYSATVSRDSVLFEAMNIKSSRPTVSVVLDSTGRLNSWIWKGSMYERTPR
jgi:hypothetical protein